MKTYDFKPDEFAKLDLLLTRMVAFHHQQRDKAELDAFRSQIFPLLREVAYDVVGGKISDEQRTRISEDDPWDLPAAQAINFLQQVFDE